MLDLLRTLFLFLAVCCLAISPGSAAPAVPAATGVDGADEARKLLREGAVAARADGDTLSWEDLDAALLDRFSGGREGQEILARLVQARVLEALAAERGVTATDAEVDARWSELDREARQAGNEEGLAGMLRSNRIDPSYFRDMLRIALLQEEMARQDLAIPDGRPVSGDQQEIWAQQMITERACQQLPAPWSDGVVARCDGLEVSLADYRAALRRQLPLDDVRETCYQLLLAARARARMPDLSPAALTEAIENEVERRRREAELDPRHKGVPFESLLQAQGRDLAELRRDPAVLVAALAHLWVDRTAGDDRLREVYESERDAFERLYGRAVRARSLFLGAVKHPNDLQPRTFEQAEEELARLAQQAKTEQAFLELVAARSEDPSAEEDGGDTGWITRGDERVPEPVREALFGALATDGSVPADGNPIGPVRTASGCVLLWLASVRPSPGWDEMSAHVHRELRKRFLEELLARETVVTYLDLKG